MDSMIRLLLAAAARSACRLHAGDAVHLVSEPGHDVVLSSAGQAHRHVAHPAVKLFWLIPGQQ